MIIVIEGGDQAGKKTQTALLAKALKQRKIKIATFSFPDYKTPIGKEIAKYLIETGHADVNAGTKFVSKMMLMPG